MRRILEPHGGLSLPASLTVAALVGLLIGLGMAPMNQWWATLIGVGLFTWLQAGRRLRNAALHGLVAGVAVNLLNLHWISVLGVPVAVGLISFMAIWWVLWGMVVATLTRLPGWVLLVPAGWVAFELAVGSVPFGGFPWIRLALTALDQPLSGWFQIVGAPGVTFLVALVSHLVLLAVLEPPKRVVGIATAVALLAVGLGWNLLPHATPEQQVTVGVVQGNVNRVEKGTGTYARSVTGNHLSETIFLLAQNRTSDDAPLDFIVWPENATDIDPISDPSTGRVIEASVQLAGVPIFVGAVMDGPVPDSRQTSSVWWHDETGPGARYDKRNLVPFGEWIPFRDFLLPRLPILEQIGRQSIPGEGPGVVDAPTAAYRFLRVGTIICFELAWDSTSYDTITGGAQVLVSQSNTNTYAETFEVHQQMALNRMRAMETGREIVVSTLNGLTGLVDVDGNIHEVTEELTAANRTFTVPLRTNTNLSVHVAGWINLVCGVVTAGALVLAMATAGSRKPPARLRA